MVIMTEEKVKVKLICFGCNQSGDLNLRVSKFLHSEYKCNKCGHPRHKVLQLPVDDYKLFKSKYHDEIKAKTESAFIVWSSPL